MTRPPRPMRLARQTIHAARRAFLRRALGVMAGVAVAPMVAASGACGDDDDATGPRFGDGDDKANGTSTEDATETGVTDGGTDGMTGATDSDPASDPTQTDGIDTAGETGATQTGTGDIGDTDETGAVTETGDAGDTTDGPTETGDATETDTGTDTELGPDADGNPPPPAGSIKYGPIDRLPASGAIKGYAGQPYFVGVDAGAGGGAYTMTSKCTHQLCNMNGSNGRISAAGVSCRCHGAKFDLNGAGVSGPYRGPLQHYRMYLYAGDLYVNPAEPVAADVRLAL
jgi:nitrite reductase/ring-hydroxylating ferredoxin subunit